MSAVIQQREILISSLFKSKNHSKKIAITIRKTAKGWFRSAFDFSFDFFDEMLIVLLIVIFEKSPSSGSLLLFREEVLDGTSH